MNHRPEGPAVLASAYLLRRGVGTPAVCEVQFDDVDGPHAALDAPSVDRSRHPIADLVAIIGQLAVVGPISLALARLHGIVRDAREVSASLG